MIGTIAIVTLLGAGHLHNVMKQQRDIRKPVGNQITRNYEDQLKTDVSEIITNGIDTTDTHFNEGYNHSSYESYYKLTPPQKEKIMYADRAANLMSRRNVPRYVVESDNGLAPPNTHRNAYLLLSSPSEIRPGMQPVNSLDYPGATTGFREHNKRAMQKNWMGRNHTAFVDSNTPIVTQYYDLPFRPQRKR